MAFCPKCGSEVAANTQFCPKCGQAQGVAPTPAAAPGAAPAAAYQPAPAAGTGMAENVAATLCYALGWITGLIFFFVDKRPVVRFHAAQSMVTFGGLHLIHIVLGMMFGASLFYGGLTGLGFGWALMSLISLLGFVLWILCMVKAYQGGKFMLPIVGSIAEGIAGK